MTIRICAYPIRTVMFRPNCLYCGAAAAYYGVCDVQLSTIACANEEHVRWAKRDAYAWLHRNKMVRQKDYEKEPLFQQMDLLTAHIQVKRTSGAIETDWKIHQRCIDHSANIVCIEGVWSIHVFQPDENHIWDYLQKHVPLESLKQSLSEEHHALVDNLLGKLDAGFYTQAAAEHDAAALEQKSLDASAPPPPPPSHYIETMFHPKHGEVRVFNHPALDSV